MSNGADTAKNWYSGISRYQWLVPAVASLGWAFDTFEGQIFVAGMNEDERQGYLAFYNNITFAAFLFGGASGA